MNIPAWMWAGGGIAGAVAIFLIGRRFLGWKASAIAAALFVAVGAFRALLARAKAEGRAEYDRQQRQENQDAIDRGNEARRRADADLADPDRLRDTDGWRRD